MSQRKEFALEGAEFGHHEYPGIKLSGELMSLNSNIESFDQANEVVGAIADYELNLQELLERMKI